VNLEIYKQGEDFHEILDSLMPRVFSCWNGPQIGDTVLKTRFQIQGNGFGEHLLRFAAGLALGSHIKVKTEGAVKFPIPQNGASEVKLVLSF